jgi:hypothetical protein
VVEIQIDRGVLADQPTTHLASPDHRMIDPGLTRHLERASLYLGQWGARIELDDRSKHGLLNRPLSNRDVETYGAQQPAVPGNDHSLHAQPGRHAAGMLSACPAKCHQNMVHRILTTSGGDGSNRLGHPFIRERDESFKKILAGPTRA